MQFSLLIILLSFANLGNANTNEASCESFPLSSDGYSAYVACKGNFTEMENLKLYLENISDPITIFELHDAFLDVLPPDVFHDVPNPEVRKIIFHNVSMELFGIPELGDPPLKSIRDTVESFEIYYSSTVFAWDFPSLSFDNLQSIIVEDSELISITVPFFFWPELRFIQFQNSSVQWIHHKAFQGNRKLTICSLAHNKISRILRSMFPKPAAKLYSLDLSFNRLEHLPLDMFTEMDMLEELKLDNNRLKFVYQAHLQMVWNNLTQLWLGGNDIRCEYLCWMAERTEKPLFLESSKCKVTNKFIFIGRYLEECIKQITNISS